MKPIRTLRQCLIDLEPTRLRLIARLWGLEIQATRPLKIAASLAQALADPALASAAYEGLPPGERAALAALLEAGGLLPAASFTRRFGEIRPMGPGRLEREAPWRDPTGPAESLWYRGLIFEGFAGEAGEIYPVYFVPDELRAVLPVETEGAPPIIQLQAAPPPTHRRVAGDVLLDDLTSVLIFVHNRQPACRAPDAWPPEALQELARQFLARQFLARNLRQPGAERLAFMLHLLDHLDWTRLHDDGRLRLAAEPVMTWLQAAVEHSRAVLVNAWRELTDWNELWRLPSLRPDDTGTWRNDPSLARAALLRHLDSLPLGQWTAIEDFINAIKASDPDFQRPDGNYETWYIRDAASDAYLTGFESWEQVEGALLRALLTGPAWWLGLVELGAETEDGAPEFFRPAPQTPPPSPAPPRVRPDLTITMPPARRFERFQLARVADLLALDEAYVYRLTPASLQRARQQNISAARVLSFLDSLDDAPLPPGLQSSVTRWAERGTEVWLERALLLRVSDEALLQQILDAPQTKPYVIRIVGPKTVVVAEDDWPRLMEALVELGLLAELGGWNADWQNGRISVDSAHPR